MSGYQQIGDILSTNYGSGIDKQYADFVDACNFMREILTVLYNEQRATCSWDEAENLSEEALS